MKGSKKAKSTTGTEKGDVDKAKQTMQRMLGTLEPSHRKPKPIFPQSVLGHLFMRKFGLNREQRTLVIRSTGGSSRFLDVERILRASDLEDQREDRKPPKIQLKPGRREAYAVQEQDDESSSIDMPISDSGDDDAEVYMGEDNGENDYESEDELAEVFEMQKKAKRDFRKNYKTYKETKKKVKEIKKSRAGPSTYYPVVAVPPDGSAAGSSQGSTLKPFKPDSKVSKRKGDGKGPKSSGRKEDVNLTQAEIASHFSYMITEFNLSCTTDSTADDVFLASIPQGYAIVDTGCTTSVIGLETAKSLVEHFKENGFPPPVEVNLPALELKGFNGKTETTTAGLKWTCCLGKTAGPNHHICDSWCDTVFTVTKSSGSHGSCFGFETSYNYKRETWTSSNTSSSSLKRSPAFAPVHSDR